MLQISGQSSWKVNRNILRPRKDVGKIPDVQGGGGGFLTFSLQMC